MPLPPDLPDEFDDEDCSQERAARRVQWLLIAGFVCAVVAGALAS